MKIRDILFVENDIVDLVESLKHIPTDIVWDRDTATFTVNEHKYFATVRPATQREESTFAPFFNPIPKVGNVDFSLEQGDALTQDTVGTVQSGVFKVFASVAYVASELARKYGYKILLCIAKRQHSPTNYEARVEAYDAVTHRVAKNTGMMTTKLYETPNETVYVVYPHVYNDNITQIKEHLTNTTK